MLWYMKGDKSTFFDVKRQKNKEMFVPSRYMPYICKVL